MSDGQVFHIPRKAEVVAVSNKGTRIDVKPHIRCALDDDHVIDEIEGYKTDGGICGNAKLDDVRAMDVILAWDKEHGGAIRRSGLKEVEVLAQVNVEMRRRYLLDKKRKIVGINTKHYLLLAKS